MERSSSVRRMENTWGVGLEVTATGLPCPSDPVQAAGECGAVMSGARHAKDNSRSLVCVALGFLGCKKDYILLCFVCTCFYKYTYVFKKRSSRCTLGGVGGRILTAEEPEPGGGHGQGFVPWKPDRTKAENCIAHTGRYSPVG